MNSGKGSLTIVFGGQFGSEGKGQIVGHLARQRKYSHAVRVGGPNAGHTFLLPNGKKQVLQSIPIACFMDSGVAGVIGPAGVIIPELLDKEWQAACDYLDPYNPSLLIDQNVAVINRGHMAQEAASLTERIGSTGEGVGAVTADKVMRKTSTQVDRKLADHWAEGPEFFGLESGVDTAKLINNMLFKHGRDVLVEGTQGFGLSLHTGGFYPYCTSRECTPQGILGDAGISPMSAASVESIMVLRTYPIRVGGNSGPLRDEIDWETLGKRTNGYVAEPERTTVTKKVRRIAEWDWELAYRATQICRPTALALTFFDYWYPEIATAVDSSALSSIMWARVNEIEFKLGVPVKYISTGFGTVITVGRR